MLTNKPINLKALYEVVTSLNRDRGSGKTFVTSFLAIYLLKTVAPGTTIIWPVPKFAWTRHTMQEMKDQLNRYQVNYEMKQGRFYVPEFDCSIEICPFITLRERVIGCKHIVLYTFDKHFYEAQRLIYWANLVTPKQIEGLIEDARRNHNLQETKRLSE